MNPKTFIEEEEKEFSQMIDAHSRYIAGSLRKIIKQDHRASLTRLLEALLKDVEGKKDVKDVYPDSYADIHVRAYNKTLSDISHIIKSYIDQTR